MAVAIIHPIEVNNAPYVVLFDGIFLSGAIVYNILIKKNIINHDNGPFKNFITLATLSFELELILSAMFIIDVPNNGTNNINKNNTTRNTVMIIAFIFLAIKPLSSIPYIVLDVIMIDDAPFDAIKKVNNNTRINPADIWILVTSGIKRFVISLPKLLDRNVVTTSNDRWNDITP